MKKATLDNKDIKYINKLAIRYYNEITSECIEYYGEKEEAYIMRNKIIKKLFEKNT